MCKEGLSLPSLKNIPKREARTHTSAARTLDSREQRSVYRCSVTYHNHLDPSHASKQPPYSAPIQLMLCCTTPRFFNFLLFPTLLSLKSQKGSRGKPPDLEPVRKRPPLGKRRWYGPRNSFLPFRALPSCVRNGGWCFLSGTRVHFGQRHTACCVLPSHTNTLLSPLRDPRKLSGRGFFPQKSQSVIEGGGGRS